MILEFDELRGKHHDGLEGRDVHGLRVNDYEVLKNDTLRGGKVDQWTEVYWEEGD